MLPLEVCVVRGKSQSEKSFSFKSSNQIADSPSQQEQEETYNSLPRNHLRNTNHTPTRGPVRLATIGRIRRIPADLADQRLLSDFDFSPKQMLQSRFTVEATTLEEVNGLLEGRLSENQC
ncbi:hypothetical protein KOR42_24330 [Thalassoglobus neptunius]|uniref:Uncharacterized protein n=1 Tax=Thalassoglobus neptunius TaxID=1938619 RepID=A0A5C5X840_9PLAN|nr:hypothetical protein KOR42_24330 [Thalassoglobus neptunius]